MTLETLHTVEDKSNKTVVIMSSMDPRIANADRFRVISDLTRDFDYAGFVYKDKWGAPWRLKNAELECLVDAMEKWS